MQNLPFCEWLLHHQRGIITKLLQTAVLWGPSFARIYCIIVYYFFCWWISTKFLTICNINNQEKFKKTSCVHYLLHYWSHCTIPDFVEIAHNMFGLKMMFIKNCFKTFDFTLRDNKTLITKNFGKCITDSQLLENWKIRLKRLESFGAPKTEEEHSILRIPHVL